VRLIPTSALSLTVPLLVSLSLTPAGQSQNIPTAADREKLVQLQGIDVKGTRLPAQSIIRLSGLKVGQQVNYTMVDEASRKITSTGLVKMIDSSYDTYPGKPGIVLSLNVVDELPLFPVKITPADDSERIWQCLQTADPIFMREMPRTEKAISFYQANIERCLKNQGRSSENASSLVSCDPEGNPAEVVFRIRPSRAAPPRTGPPQK